MSEKEVENPPVIRGYVVQGNSHGSLCYILDGDVHTDGYDTLDIDYDIYRDGKWGVQFRFGVSEEVEQGPYSPMLKSLARVAECLEKAIEGTDFVLRADDPECPVPTGFRARIECGENETRTFDTPCDAVEAVRETAEKFTSLLAQK